MTPLTQIAIRMSRYLRKWVIAPCSKTILLWKRKVKEIRLRSYTRNRSRSPRIENREQNVEIQYCWLWVHLNSRRIEVRLSDHALLHLLMDCIISPQGYWIRVWQGCIRRKQWVKKRREGLCRLNLKLKIPSQKPQRNTMHRKEEDVHLAFLDF